MVLDFGICKLMSSEALMSNESTLTRTGSVMGTPYYMSPEQVFGERDVDARADVWAIGVMLYECCTGQRPFEGENIGQLIKHVLSGSYRPLSEVAPHLPESLSVAIARMLTFDRTQRAPDLREVFEVLRATSTVSAPSFKGAAQLRSAPSEAPPDVALLRKPDLAAAVAEAKPSTSSSERRPNRALPWLAGLGLVLVGGAGTVLIRGTLLAPTPSPPSLNAPALAASGAAPSPPAAPLPTPSPPSSSIASERAPSPSAKPRAVSAQPKPPPRTLAGGVHGDVPF
jgi:serine/threonine-protein kinase